MDFECYNCGENLILKNTGHFECTNSQCNAWWW